MDALIYYAIEILQENLEQQKYYNCHVIYLQRKHCKPQKSDKKQFYCKNMKSKIQVD